MNSILFVGEHPKIYNVRRHVHDHWELIYCTGGKGTFHFDNGIILSYKEGDVVAVPPQEPHANFSKEGFTNIHITMSEPSFPYKSTFRIQDDEEGNVKMAFLQARYYYMSDVKNADLVLSALGDLIVSYMIVCRSNLEFSEPVERIRTSIRRNYSRLDYTLDQVLREMPFHYDYLRKLFKKEVGVSPLEYLTGLRMKSAESLLTAMWTNEYSVTEIAQMCGYEDAQYFSRVFKKHYGCSPSAFAREHNKPHQHNSGMTEFLDEEDAAK